MQRSRKIQIVTIAGALVLTVALYSAPRKSSSQKPVVTALQDQKQDFNFEELLSFQKKNLSAENLQNTENWIAQLNQPASRVNLNLYDSLAKVWDEKKMFPLSAHYYELKSEKDNSEKSFLNAAYRYFDAYKEAIDSNYKASMVDKAVKNYLKVIELNPKNLDAKTDLGVLYAEGTPEPMKGIMLLREVVAENPKHENAQLNLGFLSVKSGQFEKALERFNKVMEINPKRIDVYLYKAQTFEQMGDKQKAIEEFENYNNTSSNFEMIAEVKKHISELKGN